MSFLRGLMWFLFAIALIAVAMYVTGNYEVAERFTGLFLTVEQWLPISINPDQFLVLLTVLSLVVTAIVISVSAAVLVVLGGRLAIAHQKQLGQAAAAKREIGHVKEETHRHYEQLRALGVELTKRLDKRVLIQGIIEAASRLTSVAQANSIVSCWLLHFETDTFRFEKGIYCDETMFTQETFLPTDAPFARVLSTQKPLTLPAWNEGLKLVKPDKAAQLGASTAVMVVPLLVEDSVLGVLVVLCHPDVLKSFETRKPFYDVLWGELGLALAIAIQGEVAILDRLTGVHNREYFMKRLIQEIERANRFQLALSLFMVDIDDFKQVNDTLGHPQGDAVLKIISKLIKKEVRAIDLVGRYGGEEFIVMLPETGFGEEPTSSTTGALLVAERIRKAIDEEFQGMQKPLNLTVSIGVAVRRFPQDRNADYRDLVRLADEQLYRAKTAGKNRVCVVIPEKEQEEVT